MKEMGYFRSLFVIFAMAMLIVNIPAAAEKVDVIHYDDGTDDVEGIGTPPENRSDIDIISVTCDRSSYPVVVTLIVAGEIVPGYPDEDSENFYGIGMDLDGDEDYAEINVQLTGSFYGTEEYITISTPETIEGIDEGMYTIEGSKLEVKVEERFFGDHDEVLDINGAAQYLSSTTGANYLDSANYNFGGDDLPYQPGDDDTTDDDDTSDDDTTDDDTVDDDSTEEDDDADDSPGLGILGIAISILFLALIRKKRSKN